MAQYPPATYHLDDDEQTIRGLEFKCNPHSDKSMWISPVGHRGVLTMHTKTHPLLINYIADDRKSILIPLDDPTLRGVLEGVETKVIAQAPAPDMTQPLINRDAAGKYTDSLKLKTQYTAFFCADSGEALTAEEALGSRRNRLTSWVLSVYRLNEFRGKWYFSVVLRSAKVSRAAESPESHKRKRGEDDFTQYL
jgi:hypothetical protein